MRAAKSFFSAPAIRLLLRVLVTTSILVLIVRSINAQQAWRVMANAQADLLAAALVMQFASTAISAYRWQLIMRNLQFGQSFTFYWRSYFKGMFFNQGLPTSIGGDAIRVLDVARCGFRKRDALYGVAIDRIAGLGALILLTFVAYVFDSALLPLQVYRLMLLLTVLGLSGIASLLVLNRISWLNRYSQWAFVKAISDRLDLAFANNRFMLFILSILVPIFAMLGFYATGWALGLRYDLMTYFAIVPPALILTIIPASIAGWGVREGALVGLFSLIGADETIVLMMSLLYGITLIIVSIPGLIVFLQGRQRIPTKLSDR
ncbi:lysylphosphatidylglycerol synthase transmembrane domain-containing protein [Rugosibacter aromaticivorans]|uniref:lysylphosphatidylglycerol synthase transmembrane domain-containing protein n=1 Tax=Rugosibacter aromaticivorans TaxID=1565605 RepID=UPI000AAFCF1C|nr:lysylphosphatidylglycerol synthase transmembrane domain-containing protein [Rugosibacter aromaticivorans]TBR15881.1 MAG: flippase-like domain-containing protein [Rugosibacter sp.]